MKNLICFAVDDSYLQYLYKALKAIVKYAKDENTYEIAVLYKEKTNFSFTPEKENIQIRIIDVKNYVKNITIDMSNVNADTGAVKETTFYRCFIPEIFKNYDQVLYLDTDILIRDDIYDIFYEFDINSDSLFCVSPLLREYNKLNGLGSKLFGAYCKNKLGISVLDYFSTGVLLFNIKKCIEAKFVRNVMNFFISGEKLLGNDNDLICMLAKGKVQYYSMPWAIEEKCIQYKDKFEDKEAFENPKIVHFSGKDKPWNNENLAFADEWKEL